MNVFIIYFSIYTDLSITCVLGQLVIVAIEPAVFAPSMCLVSKEEIWQCKVGPVNASMQAYTIVAESNYQMIALRDVLFGDVWVSSRSNSGCHSSGGVCSRGSHAGDIGSSNSGG